LRAQGGPRADRRCCSPAVGFRGCQADQVTGSLAEQPGPRHAPLELSWAAQQERAGYGAASHGRHLDGLLAMAAGDRIIAAALLRL
jgi:hypothetical protein